MDRRHKALLAAIQILGGVSATARAVERSQPTVSGWVKNERPCPAEAVLALERASGVSRHKLRPDLYPAEAA